MKKIILLLLLFYQTSSFSQPDGILNVIVSPIDETTINVYSIVHFLNVTEYINHEIDIENNTINLNLCYHISVFPLEDTVTHNNLIDVIGLTGEYTLNINIFEDSEGCYINVLDSASMSLTLPLDEEVTLANPTFSLQNNITIYPNPVKKTLQINMQSQGFGSIVRSIHVYDAMGKKLLETNNGTQLDVSNLASGLLFIKIETNKGIITKKVIKE